MWCVCFRTRACVYVPVCICIRVDVPRLGCVEDDHGTGDPRVSDETLLPYPNGEGRARDETT